MDKSEMDSSEINKKLINNKKKKFNRVYLGFLFYLIIIFDINNIVISSSYFNEKYDSCSNSFMLFSMNEFIIIGAVINIIKYFFIILFYYKKRVLIFIIILKLFNDIWVICGIIYLTTIKTNLICLQENSIIWFLFLIFIIFHITVDNTLMNLIFIIRGI